MKKDRYESTLSSRYASEEMLYTFSAHFKYSTWRKLWIALAEEEMALGLPITQKQIDELKAYIDDIPYERVEEHEEAVSHDVMAHILAYGEQCPTAKSIIHLGATSCYVTDNGDLIQMKTGLNILQKKLRTIIEQLSTFAKQYADLPCLGFTHFQPAQLTTVGKRACLWLQDFVSDIKEIDRHLRDITFLGVKGAIGTQGSFLTLFNGNYDKVNELEKRIANKMGFSNVHVITGQTYPRKEDDLILSTLSHIAVSSHKFGNDLRLLAHMNEIEEPFKSTQVGSSAMPYKRNPILAERVCALARCLISLAQNASYTAALQWLERTLDDSANRRLTIPEAFLTCDAILELLIKLTKNLHVNPAVIARRVKEEISFLATEQLLMAGVKKGGDRQELHEKLRQHSHAAANQRKEKGIPSDLIERLSSDTSFSLTKEEIEDALNEKQLVGCAPKQVAHYVDSISQTYGL